MLTAEKAPRLEDAQEMREQCTHCTGMTRIQGFGARNRSARAAA
jgi:hypothetical protein